MSSLDKQSNLCPKHPKILEINTWPWLYYLSHKYKQQITLNNIPAEFFDLHFIHFDVIWLMGVWERSVEGRNIAIQHPGLQEEYKQALKVLSNEDVVGSPYSIYDYQVDTKLGGEQGLIVFRKELKKRNKLLLVDYVPNHLSVDHKWTLQKPEIFMTGTQEDLNKTPDNYFVRNNRIFAYGKDPNFPPWTDTVQINAFSSEARESAIKILLYIASKSDGVRCDMAMLFLNDVFRRTWGVKAGRTPEKEFWKIIIPKIKEKYPNFLFIAEVYWNMEWELQQLGFDFCYDKRLYERLAHGNSQSILAHIRADLDFQSRLVRFIENHDEERVISLFGRERSMAAAIIALTLPGARMIYEGQVLGHKIKLPVQLGRTPFEENDEILVQFYQSLLAVVPDKKMTKHGIWSLNTVIPISNNDNSHLNLISYQWKSNEIFQLIVVNFSAYSSKGHVKMDKIDYNQNGEKIIFEDVLNDKIYTYNKNDIEKHGLYVELEPWKGHIFDIKRKLV
ncbi:MAG: alpha-amylase family glycosyl hydrolase [Promethearchaeota archaeon]